MICWSLVGSPPTTTGMSFSISSVRSSSLLKARSANNSTVPSTVCLKLKSILSSFILSDSIFEKSRMSLMMLRSSSPDLRTVPAKLRCFSVRSVSSKSSVIPNTPFMGVRISWLMEVRNCDFAWLADSAASLASSSCFWAASRSVMSWETQTMPVTSPFSASITDPEKFTGICFP